MISLAGIEPCLGVFVVGIGEVNRGVKLNLRRSLNATTLGDIIDDGLVIVRGEGKASALEGDHMVLVTHGGRKLHTVAFEKGQLLTFKSKRTKRAHRCLTEPALHGVSVRTY